ncbi:uncharacterized protein [Anolis sagrei]|uniref:uncharacterized protein n=1 Tax=Anolis sagrei TaxID=38937 RepID=UPI003521D30E
MAFPCCCCSWFSVAGEEREPLNIQHPNKCRESNRTAGFSKDKPLTVKRVNMPEIDTLFDNIAETFNKQQGNCLALWEAIQGLKKVYNCSPASYLSVCMEKIQQEHSDYSVQVHMEGYRFGLNVGDKEIPEQLKQAQEQVGELNRATIGIISSHTKLQEMIHSVLQSQDKLRERIKVTNSEHLDWIRLEGNLTENIEKIRLAEQFSKQYKEEANGVLREMSKSAGLAS